MAFFGLLVYIPRYYIFSTLFNHRYNLFFYVIAINIYFYAVIAIWLIDKIKRKFRYIALTFCVLFFICTDSPFNAKTITNHIWLHSIENALIEQGYTQFPLSGKDENEFIKALKKSEDNDAQKILTRIQKLDDAYLARYFSGKISIYNESEPESKSSRHHRSIRILRSNNLAFGESNIRYSERRKRSRSIGPVFLRRLF